MFFYILGMVFVLFGLYLDVMSLIEQIQQIRYPSYRVSGNFASFFLYFIVYIVLQQIYIIKCEVFIVFSLAILVEIILPIISNGIISYKLKRHLEESKQ